jgi:hypothetical protein
MPLASSAVLILRSRFVSEISKGGFVLRRITLLKVVYLSVAALAREENGGESGASKDECEEEKEVEEEEEEEEEEEGQEEKKECRWGACAAASIAPAPFFASAAGDAAAFAGALPGEPLDGSFAAKKGCGSPAVSPVALFPALHMARCRARTKAIMLALKALQSAAASAWRATNADFASERPLFSHGRSAFAFAMAALVPAKCGQTNTRATGL